MNRRNGMWLTVLCILAAGIFTTSVTSSFVRESTEAAMAAVTETEARGAQIPVPREAYRTGSFPKGSDGPGRCRRPGERGGKAPQAAGGKEPGIWLREPRAGSGCPGDSR